MTKEEQIKKVIIIEDEQEYAEFINKCIIKEHILPIYYRTPTQATIELEKTKYYPSAYFVDMRIPKDLEGPETFFRYIEEKHSTENFYFITGILSEHDKEVKERTGAKVLIKGIFEKEILPKILKKL